MFSSRNVVKPEGRSFHTLKRPTLLHKSTIIYMNCLLHCMLDCCCRHVWHFFFFFLFFYFSFSFYKIKLWCIYYRILLWDSALLHPYGLCVWLAVFSLYSLYFICVFKGFRPSFKVSGNVCGTIEHSFIVCIWS